MKIKLFLFLSVLALICILLLMKSGQQPVDRTVNNDEGAPAVTQSQVDNNNAGVTETATDPDTPLSVPAAKPNVVKGTIDMEAPGKGDALFMTLALNHGKVELGYAVSVPADSIKKATQFANYLAVIKDIDGNSIQRVPVRLQGRRAVLSEPGSEPAGCDCEEDAHFMEGTMRFKKFTAKPQSLAVYKLEKPYVRSEKYVSFDSVIDTMKLTLIEEVKL